MTSSGRATFSNRGRRSHGSPISDLMAHALGNPKMISLAAGFVDNVTLPAVATETAIGRILEHPVEAQQALQYGTTAGYFPLREAVLERSISTTSFQNPPSPEQVVLTAGSNQLLHLVAEVLFDPGDIVLCAAPTYFVFLGMLENLGVRAIGVETDDQGMIPAALDETLKRFELTGEAAKIKAVYLVTYCDNPCGVTLAADRRQAIMEVMERNSGRQQIVVLDDQAYQLLHDADESIPGLAEYDTNDRTVVAGTFSKSFSPGIRVGWGVLPRDLATAVLNLKGNLDFGSPNWNQHLMHRVLQLGLFDTHVERLRVAYRRKRQAMLDALKQSLAPRDDVRWIHPDGGLYVWLTLPEQLSAGANDELFRTAVSKGVLYVPGEYCYPAEGVAVQHNSIRLSFGVPQEDVIREGIGLLAEAIEQTLMATQKSSHESA